MDEIIEILKNLGSDAAVMGVILSVLYKIWRILKSDNREDSLHADEQDFRKVLLDEMERLKKDREELIKAAIPTEKRLYQLESSCAGFKSYCRKCVTTLKTKTYASDPDIVFLIKKGEELIDFSNSTRPF